MDPASGGLSEGATLAFIGLFVTMVSAQVWMIKTLTSQIQTMTDKFLNTMENTVGKNTEELSRVTAALAALQAAIQNETSRKDRS